jgi:hypothetical protein
VTQAHALSEAFKADKLAGLPARWRKRIGQRYADLLPGGKAWPGGNQDADFFANREIAKITGRLATSRLPLDAKDSDICHAADFLASRVGEMAQTCHDAASLRAAMGRLAAGQGIDAPAAKVKDAPALARLACPLWWRRKLRRTHAKIVEGSAISLGYVNRAQDCYVSTESVWRRADQNERNAASLEATNATNEHGQTFTLAELAATGPANKAIRRGELMTRISGFERIAKELGHVGLFFTVTCPSRMHKWSTVKGDKKKVFENKNYDGTLPGDAQKYLAKVWSRIRAKLKRKGIGQYGFRIAEPNHDGCPHWHLLIFIEPERLNEFRAVVLHYALQDSPDEKGAHDHRVDFRMIDGRGAAGYIAKYVAKNIDGYKLDKDLFENDAIQASHRVEAWASTWSVRQFQQIGGPPVGVWRELRRVEDIPAGAPSFLIDAHQACNRIEDKEAGTVKAAAWEHYVNAQGGVFCGRGARIKLATVLPDGLNGYGEPAAAKVIGVQTQSREVYTPAHMAHMNGKATRLIDWIVESKRHTWTITRKPAGAVPGLVPEFEAASRPWTCVNNCTKEANGQTESGDFESENGVGISTGPRQDHGRGLRVAPAGSFGSDWGASGHPHGAN